MHRYRQHKIKCRSELYAMKHAGHADGGGVCDVDPPLISAANVGYGVTVAPAGVVDDLAMTSLPLPLSPTCRHYDSPYDVHRGAVTWSRGGGHHAVDDDFRFRSDLVDGHYGTQPTSRGHAHSHCARRHRPVIQRLQPRLDCDTTAVRLPAFDCNSTSLRPVDHLRYDQAGALRPK